jgi:hypothetical protein
VKSKHKLLIALASFTAILTGGVVTANQSSCGASVCIAGQPYTPDTRTPRPNVVFGGEGIEVGKGGVLVVNVGTKPPQTCEKLPCVKFGEGVRVKTP